MFDLVVGAVDRPFHERSVRSNVVSIIGHAVVLLGVMGLSFASLTYELPRVRPIAAFVVAEAPVAAPAPPPPAVHRATAPKPSPVASTAPPRPGTLLAPVEAPAELRPAETEAEARPDNGVEGGVAGGVAGGVIGGSVGGSVLPAEPPPPRPPVAPPAPVRMGGLLAPPTLLHRVQPTYPPLAAAAHVTGVVVLEATVGTDGCVQAVRVLASIPLLDTAAVDAVKQWRYAPVMFNGVPTPFILTVTVSFSTTTK